MRQLSYDAIYGIFILTLVHLSLIHGSSLEADNEGSIRFEIGEVSTEEDISHLREHMTAEETHVKINEDSLLFHFFRLHDTDKNNKLDGMEILLCLQHNMKEKPLKRFGATSAFKKSLEYFIPQVDKLLTQDDANEDGYLDYTEFRISRLSQYHNIRHHRQPAS